MSWMPIDAGAQIRQLQSRFDEQIQTFLAQDGPAMPLSWAARLAEAAELAELHGDGSPAWVEFFLNSSPEALQEREAEEREARANDAASA